MPEDRMLERLEKLEGIVETTVQILPPLINDLSRRIDGLREEVQGMEAKLEGRIQALESKLERQIQAVETRLEGRIQEVKTSLEGQIQAVETKLEGRIESLRREVKAEINTAFNKTMLLLTAIGVVLALLSLFR
jgi:Mg2+ and Co2+ transporter CorA